MWHRKSYTVTLSRKNRHLIVVGISAERLRHHLQLGTGGTIQKKMKKNVARMISQRINRRKMIPHNNRVRESCLQEKEILVPQILSPNRVRDSRPQNSDESADTTSPLCKHNKPVYHVPRIPAPEKEKVLANRNALPKMSPTP